MQTDFHSTRAFAATFTRWDAKRGQRRQSAPFTIHAPNWTFAERQALAILEGMRAADTACEYELAGLAMTGLGGDACYQGWETQAEWSARVNATAPEVGA